MYSNEFQGPGFVGPSDNDFHLEADAFVIDKGTNSVNISPDIEGNPRNDGAPDLGCYEFN
jgi:hypothetical protein